MDAVHLYDQQAAPISYDLWLDLVKVVEWVCRNWRRPDKSIWEIHGRAKRFLYSNAMCWVALDRGLNIARRRSFPAPVTRWHRIRDQIFQDVYDEFWNGRLKAFVQFRGAKAVDAANLLLPLFKFISAGDPRWRSTLKMIEQSLVEDALVYRYRTGKTAASNGLPGTEGSFSVCSFWYAECLALGGDAKQGRFVFEKALGCANHLGLFSEQLGPAGEHLGNFPLALPHLGLISAAWELDGRE
jgi:GH15 family glucan-1,4-alpha-glucosidase